ncbi:hypothetical protein ACI3K4_30885 [Streptomyces sp. CSMPJR101]|uniref:hypothetical protein n=1 Tax=Streptomyces sp. CSMPJR101 TaxID=1279378 RepID=UPI003852EE6D
MAVVEEGLTELTAEDVWGEDDGSGAYYLLGTWLDGRIVVHGDSGTVHRLPAEGEETDPDPEVAASLGQFVTMLQNYVLGRCLLPMGVEPNGTRGCPRRDRGLADRDRRGRRSLPSLGRMPSMTTTEAMPPAPSAVSPEQALAELLEWSEGGTASVAELTGPPGSGRTETLLRLSEARSGAVLVDATGLTCEDVIERVMSAAGCADLPEKRADWGWELEGSPLAGGLVVILNAHRAGRTRRSSEPERMVHRFTVELAVAGRLKVVIERDLPDVRRAHDHLVVALGPNTADGPVGLLPDGLDSDALRALALAEVRRAPMSVWTALAQELGVHVGRSLDVAAALEASGDPLEVDGEGWVRFRDERHAETLRRSTAAEVVRAVNGELVAWLRDQAAGGSTGQYLAQGLAMHAVQAGQFDAVQRSGGLVARIDQVALMDAAHADDAYAVSGGPRPVTPSTCGCAGSTRCPRVNGRHGCT